MQPFHAAKLAGVVDHQGEMVRQSNGNDHQIIGANWRSSYSQIGTNASISIGGSIVKRQALEQLKQSREQAQIVFSARASVGAVELFRLDHGTEGDVGG